MCHLHSVIMSIMKDDDKGSTASGLESNINEIRNCESKVCLIISCVCRLDSDLATALFRSLNVEGIVGPCFRVCEIDGPH